VSLKQLPPLRFGLALPSLGPRGLFSTLALIFTLTAGCSTTHSLPMEKAQPEGNLMLPPVSVFVEYPSGRVHRSEIDALARIPILLKETNAFLSVGAAPNWPNQIIIHCERKGSDDLATGLAKAVILGGSLGLIPVHMIKRVECAFIVKTEGKPPQTFSYADTIDMYASLFNTTREHEEEAHKRILFNFVSDLRESKLLRTPQLREQQGSNEI
jgi:hypothetical protein